MFRAMPADGNPPLYFLLVRLCLHLPVSTELAVRLPSVLAFPASALAAFVFVRRLAPFRFALLSMCLLLGSDIGEQFGVEGRPYALLMFFTALQLCFWQLAKSKADRRWALMGITLCTSGAILSHQYGIIYAVLPIATGEAIRFVQSRRLDAGIMASVGLGSLTILGTYPPMLHTQALLLNAIRSSPTFWARPGWLDLGCYGEMQPTYIALLVLLVAAAWGLAWAGWSTFRPQRIADIAPPIPLQAEDIAVADMLALFLPIMLLLTHLGTNYFVARYAIGSALGVALLVGILAAYAGARWHFFKGLVSLIVLYCVTIGTLRLWIQARPNPPVDYGASLFASVPDAEPIVFASALDFMPSWWYADGPTRQRLHYLSDLQASKTTPDMIPEYSMFLERYQTPMQMEDYGPFVRTHNTFLIYSAGLPRLEWLPQRLVQEGWDLTLIVSGKRGKLFRAKAPLASQRAMNLPTGHSGFTVRDK